MSFAFSRCFHKNFRPRLKLKNHIFVLKTLALFKYLRKMTAANMLKGKDHQQLHCSEKREKIPLQWYNILNHSTVTKQKSKAYIIPVDLLINRGITMCV